MKLLTKEIKKKLPKLYETESVKDGDKVAVVKFFLPCGRATWYACEFDGKDTFFGYAISPLGPDCDEWGYFSLSELESLKAPFGLSIERDLGFEPTVMGEILNKEVR